MLSDKKDIFESKWQKTVFVKSKKDQSTSPLKKKIYPFLLLPSQDVILYYLIHTLTTPHLPLPHIVIVYEHLILLSSFGVKLFTPCPI